MSKSYPEDMCFLLWISIPLIGISKYLGSSIVDVTSVCHPSSESMLDLDLKTIHDLSDAICHPPPS